MRMKACLAIVQLQNPERSSLFVKPRNLEIFLHANPVAGTLRKSGKYSMNGIQVLPRGDYGDLVNLPHNNCCRK